MSKTRIGKYKDVGVWYDFDEFVFTIIPNHNISIQIQGKDICDVKNRFDIFASILPNYIVKDAENNDTIANYTTIGNYHGFDIEYDFEAELFVCKMLLMPSPLIEHTDIDCVKAKIDNHIKSIEDSEVKTVRTGVDNSSVYVSHSKETRGLIGKTVKVKLFNLNKEFRRSDIIASGLVVDKCVVEKSLSYLILLNEDVLTLVNVNSPGVRCSVVGVNKRKGETLLVDCNQIVEVINLKQNNMEIKRSDDILEKVYFGHNIYRNTATRLYVSYFEPDTFWCAECSSHLIEVVESKIQEYIQTIGAKSACGNYVYIVKYKDFAIEYDAEHNNYVGIHPSPVIEGSTFDVIKAKIDDYVKSKSEKLIQENEPIGVTLGSISERHEAIDNIEPKQNNGLIGKTVSIEFKNWRDLMDRHKTIVSVKILDKYISDGNTFYLTELLDDLMVNNRELRMKWNADTQKYEDTPELVVEINKKKGDLISISPNKIIKVLN